MSSNKEIAELMLALRGTVSVAEIEQALNEAEERGQKSQPTFEAGYTRGHLDGRIYGQREMRERVALVVESHIEKGIITNGIPAVVRSLHLTEEQWNIPPHNPQILSGKWCQHDDPSWCTDECRKRGE